MDSLLANTAARALILMNAVVRSSQSQPDEEVAYLMREHRVQTNNVLDRLAERGFTDVPADFVADFLAHAIGEEWVHRGYLSVSWEEPLIEMLRGGQRDFQLTADTSWAASKMASTVAAYPAGMRVSTAMTACLSISEQLRTQVPALSASPALEAAVYQLIASYWEEAAMRRRLLQSVGDEGGELPRELATASAFTAHVYEGVRRGIHQLKRAASGEKRPKA